MICSGFLFMAFCLLKDYLVFEKVIYKIRNRSAKTPPKPSKMDDDVQAESDKINKLSSLQLKSTNLVLQGLTKYYANHLAVNQLSIGVEKGECFGLLGINGAGKTSTFKMMTGDELISGGDVWIRGSSMKNNMLKAQKSIGYCPQFDALFFDISGRESLKIFSLIRGIPREEIDAIIMKLSTELGFQMHLDKKIKAYSGGNKRKISTALVSCSRFRIIQGIS
jgi:ATP-binding cassette, subfamily A (ABC1), member 3